MQGLLRHLHDTQTSKVMVARHGSTFPGAVICRVTGVSGRPAFRTTSTVGRVVPGVSSVEGYDPATTWYPDTGDRTVGSLVKRSLTVAAPTLLPCMGMAA